MFGNGQDCVGTVIKYITYFNVSYNLLSYEDYKNLITYKKV